MQVTYEFPYQKNFNQLFLLNLKQSFSLNNLTYSLSEKVIMYVGEVIQI